MNSAWAASPWSSSQSAATRRWPSSSGARRAAWSKESSRASAARSTLMERPFNERSRPSGPERLGCETETAPAIAAPAGACQDVPGYSAGSRIDTLAAGIDERAHGEVEELVVRRAPGAD